MKKQEREGVFKMNEDITKEEMEKAKEAFYSGDIGSDTETGYKLLNKDEETINLIGKVLFNLADNKMNDDFAEDLDSDEIAEVVGSLMIDQFKGDDKQDHYRAVINEIFKQYKDRDV
tara:strand:+ start:490 stop:840 length:351 start_codon:yes stop_codon:yes gene_type:complete